ncbi:MAG: phage holin family protein [Bryobacteraceae bacterium]
MIAAPTTVAKAKVAWIAAAVAGIWGGFHPLIQTLVVLILLDFASGLLYAWSTGAVSSDASYRGMAKKAMMLLLTGAASAYNATQPLGFDAGAAVAGFFCTTELISITENAGRLGLPIPKPLMDAMAKLGGGNGEPKP